MIGDLDPSARKMLDDDCSPDVKFGIDRKPIEQSEAIEGVALAAPISPFLLYEDKAAAGKADHGEEGDDYKTNKLIADAEAELATPPQKSSKLIRVKSESTEGVEFDTAARSRNQSGVRTNMDEPDDDQMEATMTHEQLD